MKKKIFIFYLILLYANIGFAQRIDFSINSVWRFHKGDFDGAIADIDAEKWEIVNIPHTWNASDAFDEDPGYYRGVGWYTKELKVPLEWKGKRVVIYFEGANQTTDVFVNRAKVGNHIGGYTAFSFDLSDQLKYGEINTIAVKVDNGMDADVPPLSADFTFYGGIYRNVKIIVAESVHFDLTNNASDGIFVETPIVNEQSAMVSIRGSIKNNTSDTKSVIIETLVFDKENKLIISKSVKKKLEPDSKTGFLIENLSISNPKLWSPDNPYLYQASTIIKEDREDGAVLDNLILPLGLRWFDFDAEGRFLLNGEPLKLIGANRHQDFLGKGNALSDDYHYNDYKHIKELGFNFVRLAHYPQAPEVYRACDELGILVWSEIPIVNTITESEAFEQNSLNMQREHIRQTYNHPSVVLYGYMNEQFLLLEYFRGSESEKEQKAKKIVALAQQLNDLTKEESPTRYSVMAFHGNQSYNEWGLAEVPDVVGWNLYFGWYYQELEDLTKFLDEENRKYPGRPTIVSEYGPGADVRIHSREPVAWDYSEDYQYKLHASYLKQMMNLPYLAGFAAWNFADFGSEMRSDAIPFVNQKGLVNYDRTEKDVCALYRAWFKQNPVLYIASRNYTERAGMENTKESGVCIDLVKIFSNEQSVELLLNGKSLGKKQVKDYEVNFEVPFQDGKNSLLAVSNNGHSDQIQINYTVIPANLEENGVKELAINVGAKVSFYDPESKVLWIPDKEYTANSWGYIGGTPYITAGQRPKTGISNNILGTECDPLYQTFVEGLSSYKFDVPNGKYKITLCFQENISREKKNDLIYNFLNNNKDEEAKDPREFNVVINGKEVVKDLNLEKSYGSMRAVSLDFEVEAENEDGLKIDFSPISGKALLSGIRIRTYQ
ncbi:glycoside hydrolase family 2 TIM barrel-domain containing protein [uncultured Draconibacterium sp.]|uniref:glycoside hydrolase family 2 TIM barrel-domain containing protein n=1 Tax=uncultured Draconibacterium sp. TaxID=1573823 RepID=UPI0032162535